MPDILLDAAGNKSLWGWRKPPAMRGYYYIILSQFEREAFNSGVYELIFCVSRKSYLYLYHSIFT